MVQRVPRAAARMYGKFLCTSGEQAFITGITAPIPSNMKKLKPIISKYVSSLIASYPDFGCAPSLAAMSVISNMLITKQVTKIITTPKMRPNLNLSRSRTQVKGAKTIKITKAVLYLKTSSSSLVILWSPTGPWKESETLYTMKAS